jgi:hypothetical protein
MSTSQALSDTYQLKWLYQEIDLYDRKLAHIDKYNPDASLERKKIVTKRGALEKTARQMAADGTICDPKDLPRSFRSSETAA